MWLLATEGNQAYVNQYMHKIWGSYMANNIDTHVVFENINDNALSALKALFENVQADEDGYTYIDYALMKILKISDRNLFDADEMAGSKWVYVEDSDFDKGHCYLRLVSAWDAPIKAIKTLFLHLVQLDNKLVISLRHDDGGYDFGWMVLSFANDKLVVNAESLEREDIAAMIAEEDSEFAKMDEDDEAYGEYIDDNFYDYFHQYVDPKIREAIEAIKQ